VRRHVLHCALGLGCGASSSGPGDSTDTGDAGTSTTTAAASTDVADDDGSSTSGVDDGDADTSTGDDPPPEPVPGVLAEYFADYHDLVLARVEPAIDHDWELAAPDPALGIDRFSLRYTGWITAPTTDTYTFVTLADDGVRLTIDGTPVIDDWIPHYVTRNEGTLAMTAGVPVPFTLEYFEADIEASVSLSWSTATIAEALVPTSALTTTGLPTLLGGPKPPFTNPVVGFDCPDPGVIATGRADVAYAMVCTGGSFPIRGSRDLVSWSDTGVAVLPAGKPSWAANGFRNWAPELHGVGDRLVAYFTSVDGGDTLCIGAATADTIAGPWTESAGPLVTHGQGVIDATWVHDGTTGYLVYKIDGNSVGAPTPIFARALTGDGLSFAPGSRQVELLRNDPGTWEGGVVEAPWIVQRDGQWYLFYSGNVYDHRYRTGVARSASLLGPYEKRGAPILANNERWVGPGHGTVVVVGGIDYLVYHAWPNAGDGTHQQAAGRHVLVDRIDWIDGWPQIHDGTPSRTRQPWPGQTR
jgi:GH43 family beta-xylosidase